MTINESLACTAVATKANVYFDGKCVSHNLTLADGTKKSVGVILPASLTFNTGAPEIMECVAGACEYRLAGTDAWIRSSAGEKFSVGTGCTRTTSWPDFSSSRRSRASARS